MPLSGSEVDTAPTGKTHVTRTTHERIIDAIFLNFFIFDKLLSRVPLLYPESFASVAQWFSFFSAIVVMIQFPAHWSPLLHFLFLPVVSFLG